MIPGQIRLEKGFLKAFMTDLAGGLREIIFKSEVLEELITIGIAYDGSSFQGINDINDSDSIIIGDIETFVEVPKNVRDLPDTPEYIIMCDIYGRDGKVHPNCARSKLKELQNKLAYIWSGGNLFMGSEPEAYFIEQGKEHSNSRLNTNYFNPRDPLVPIITEITDTLDKMGFDIERSHTEVGTGQFEINWKFDTAHRTADRIQIFKLYSHKVACKYGYNVTFLPKPFPKINGSGMHCHISVSNKERNLFYDANNINSKNFSINALKFLAGIIANSGAIGAIANSTEASYARLVPGYEAPTVIAVGDCNRSVAIRIPAIPDEKAKEKGLRVELRFPDPLANPYLLAASFIACGIDGIESDMHTPEFISDNVYNYSLKEIEAKGLKILPRNLWEAFNQFKKNDILRTQLGQSMFESYKDILLEEIDVCQPYTNTKSFERHYHN